MKKLGLLTILLMVLPVLAFGQSIIDDFESSAADSVYEENIEGGPSFIDFTDDSTDFADGAASLRVKYSIGAFHPWGSFANMIHRVDDDAPTYDWSDSDSLSLWIKVLEAPVKPEYMVFRIHIADRPTPDDDVEEFIYEHATILDETSEWVQLKIPFVERETDGTVVPNDAGFILPPNNWGMPRNNNQLDRDKIVGYNLSAVTSGWTDPDNIPADSLVVLYDNFERFGNRVVPVIFFNGKSYPSSVGSFAWGGSMEIVEGAGADGITNAVKWTHGNAQAPEWGWSGIVFSFAPEGTKRNLTGAWKVDSLKFTMKADENVGTLRIQWESGANKIGMNFDPIADNAWHDYAFALADMITPFDGTTEFDTSAVNLMQILTEGTANNGIVWINNLWTGNPEIDVVPPSAPENLSALNSDYYNLVIWEDVPGESGETYSIFASKEPITDIDDEMVDIVAKGILEGEQSVTHWLQYPLTDQDVSFYYAIYCMDASGNKSQVVSTNAPITNTAKGVATIALGAPANFAVDGLFTDWEAAGIMPFEIKPSTHKTAAGTFDSDDDLSAFAYLAIDNEYLYIALDVIDDIYSFNEGGDWWQDDAMELFIGLYDGRGPKHATASRGEEPDAKILFRNDGVINDLNGQAVILTPDSAGYYIENFGADYVLEARVPLNQILFGEDEAFVPLNGMRIPIDLVFHDTDATANTRDGALALSRFNDDDSWQSPENWTYTWIGDSPTVTSVEDEIAKVVDEFELAQNYPNPFNPTTTISYTLPQQSRVNLTVYNALGQAIEVLVDQLQHEGKYSIDFDAHHLPSGIYFYKITAGNFSQTHKMMLLK